jgi:hypothetical protein
MCVMRTELQPSDREVLAGLVERVTYQNGENGFCVIRVKARGHRDLVTLQPPEVRQRTSAPQASYSWRSASRD